MKLTITGYSTALFSTWFFIEELGLLLDAGDGIASGLLQKAGRVKHIFISHADRDHLTGLLQFNQLNARKGAPVIYYPRDCGSFPALADFSAKFDPHVEQVTWNPLEEAEEVSIKTNVVVESIRNDHVPAPKELTKSLSFRVFESKQKLKPEFSHLNGKEIKRLIELHGREHLTETVKKNLINFSGDTPVRDYERWNGSNVLIHEATFLGHEEDGKIATHGNLHSRLEEVIRMVSEIEVNTLVLSHFSSRYSQEMIDAEIRKLSREYQLKIPVFRIKPGHIHRDILSEEPVYS